MRGRARPMDFASGRCRRAAQASAPGPVGSVQSSGSGVSASEAQPTSPGSAPARTAVPACRCDLREASQRLGVRGRRPEGAEDDEGGPRVGSGRPDRLLDEKVVKTRLRKVVSREEVRAELLRGEVDEVKRERPVDVEPAKEEVDTAPGGFEPPEGAVAQDRPHQVGRAVRRGLDGRLFFLRRSVEDPIEEPGGGAARRPALRVGVGGVLQRGKAGDPGEERIGQEVVQLAQADHVAVAEPNLGREPCDGRVERVEVDTKRLSLAERCTRLDEAARRAPGEIGSQEDAERGVVLGPGRARIGLGFETDIDRTERERLRHRGRPPRRLVASSIGADGIDLRALSKEVPLIRFLKKVGRQLPVLKDIHRYILALEAEREELRRSVATQRDDLAHARETTKKLWVPPGHPHSPIPDLDDVRRRESELFGKPPEELPGVDTLVEEQLTIIREMKRWGAEPPLPADGNGRRSSPDDPAYGWGDVALLHAMLRKLRPRRVVCAGAGPFVPVLLDLNEAVFGRTISITVVDPDAEALPPSPEEGGGGEGPSPARPGPRGSVRYLHVPFGEETSSASRRATCPGPGAT